jgi:hypothetical protein
MQVWFPVKEGPIRASHVWGRDTVDACIDGLEPRNSDDHTIPRFTWWDHRGTDEWIEQRFDPPRTLSSCAVYWFEDLPRKGGCAVPAAWRLLWRDGDQWQPVQNRGAYGTAKDGYNRVEFEPVTTRALRLEVKLQPNLSGGILEWQVK